MKRRLFLFLGMFCSAFNLFSQCDSMNGCRMNDMDMNSVAVLDGHQHKAGMWMFSYSYMNSLMQNNYSGITKVSDQSIFEKYIMSPINMRMDIHMLTGMYGVSNKLSLMVMLNYNYRNMDMKMLSGQMNMGMGSPSMTMKSTSRGLGDTKVSSRYNLVSTKGHSLTADVGLSLPTGSINKTEKDDLTRYGEKQVYMMQTGSGTFDLLPGITYSYRKTTYTLGAQATAVIHPYYNRQGYKLGNEFSVSAWSAYEWLKNTSVYLRLNYNMSGQIQGADPGISTPLEPAADTKNYGGSLLKGFFGMAYFFHDGFLKNTKIAAEFGLPVYQNFNGIQIATSYNSMISWTLIF